MLWLNRIQCCFTFGQEGDSKKLQKYDLEVTTTGTEEKPIREEDDSVDVDDEDKKKSEDDDDDAVDPNPSDDAVDPIPSDDAEKNEDEKATDAVSPASPGK